MSQRMDHSHTSVQVFLLFTLLNIGFAWPHTARDTENLVYPSDQVNFVGVRISADINCSWPEVWYSQNQSCEELLTRGE